MQHHLKLTYFLSPKSNYQENFFNKVKVELRKVDTDLFLGWFKLDKFRFARNFCYLWASSRTAQLHFQEWMGHPLFPALEPDDLHQPSSTFYTGKSSFKMPKRRVEIENGGALTSRKNHVQQDLKKAQVNHWWGMMSKNKQAYAGDWAKIKADGAFIVN